MPKDIETLWELYFTGRKNAPYFIKRWIRHSAFFKALLKGRPRPMKFLEVGIGAATFSMAIASLSRKVWAIDKNPGVVKDAKRRCKRLGADVDIRLGDAFDIPFPDDSFDIAFSQGVLEHFTDEEIHKLVQEQLRVAKQVLFSVPSEWHPNKLIGNERFMSVKEWLKILDGFNVTEHKLYSHVDLSAQPGGFAPSKDPTEIYFRIER